MSNRAMNLETPIVKKIPSEIFQYETNNAMIRGSMNALVGLILKLLRRLNYQYGCVEVMLQSY